MAVKRLTVIIIMVACLMAILSIPVLAYENINYNYWFIDDFTTHYRTHTPFYTVVPTPEEVNEWINGEIALGHNVYMIRKANYASPYKYFQEIWTSADKLTLIDDGTDHYFETEGEETIYKSTYNQYGERITTTPASPAKITTIGTTVNYLLECYAHHEPEPNIELFEPINGNYYTNDQANDINVSFYHEAVYQVKVWINGNESGYIVLNPANQSTTLTMPIDGMSWCQNSFNYVVIKGYDSSGIEIYEAYDTHEFNFIVDPFTANITMVSPLMGPYSNLDKPDVVANTRAVYDVKIFLNHQLIATVYPDSDGKIFYNGANMPYIKNQTNLVELLGRNSQGEQLILMARDVIFGSDTIPGSGDLGDLPTDPGPDAALNVKLNYYVEVITYWIKLPFVLIASVLSALISSLNILIGFISDIPAAFMPIFEFMPTPIFSLMVTGFTVGLIAWFFKR